MSKRFIPITLKRQVWRNAFKRLNFFYLSDKRQRFAIQTTILTVGILISQLIWEDYRLILVGILALASYILTIWSLSEDISGIEWILLFILPVIFTAAISLFYFLLPARWIMRLTTAVVFAIGTYAILLVENIYNVAGVRSIQLLRAAQSVGFLMTLVVFFLLSNIMFSLRLNFWLNMLIASFFTFILGLQSIWSINLEEKLKIDIIIYTAVVSLGIGELAMGLSFWPIENTSFSLLLTAGYYSLIGYVQKHFSGRLFGNILLEYVGVFIFTLALAFLTTKWGG